MRKSSGFVLVSTSVRKVSKHSVYDWLSQTKPKLLRLMGNSASNPYRRLRTGYGSTSWRVR